MRLYDHLRPYTESNGLGETLVSLPTSNFRRDDWCSPLYRRKAEAGRRRGATSHRYFSQWRCCRLRRRAPIGCASDASIRMRASRNTGSSISTRGWSSGGGRETNGPRFSSISSHGCLVLTLRRSRLVSKNYLRRSSSESRSRLFPIGLRSSVRVPAAVRLTAVGTTRARRGRRSGARPALYSARAVARAWAVARDARIVAQVWPTSPPRLARIARGMMTVADRQYEHAAEAFVMLPTSFRRAATTPAEKVLSFANA
jgi:hypothetical protein